MTVEAELSGWLSDVTANGDQRRTAEKLFNNYQVDVTVVKGKFTKLQGSEHDVNNLEQELMSTFIPDAADGAGAGTEAGAEQSRDPSDQFVDEMDVEEYTWHYLLFKHVDLLAEFASKHNCGVGLKHSLDSNSQIQSRVKVTADSKDSLQKASDEMVSLLQGLMEKDIQRRPVDLNWKKYYGELEEQLKKKDVLLMSSPCYVVGPASALVDAQSIVAAKVNKLKLSARKSSPIAASVDDIKKDVFSFHIPVVGLTVHIRQGMQRLS